MRCREAAAAKAGLDEWNDSWVRHAIRANGSFEGIPAELRKNIDVDAVRGMIQARDMTRRWEAQRPGEGNQFARAMLHALGDKPDYQSAYLASEIPQGPPIGTLRPDASQRYAAMVEEGRAERAADAQPGGEATESPPIQIAMGPGTIREPDAPITPFPDFTKLADEDLQAILRQSDRDLKDIDLKIGEAQDRLKSADAASQAINDKYFGRLPVDAARAATFATANAVRNPAARVIAAEALGGPVSGAAMTVPGVAASAAAAAGVAAVGGNVLRERDWSMSRAEATRAESELGRLGQEREAYDIWLKAIRRELDMRNEVVRGAISRGA